MSFNGSVALSVVGTSVSLRALAGVAAMTVPVLLKRLWSAVSLYRLTKITGCCGRNADHSLCGHTGPCQARPGGHVLIYVAKEIVTMDQTWPSAKMVAVQDGRILSVGEELKDFDAWVKRHGTTHSVDYTFNNHVLVPGFIEQHNHPLIGGTALSLPCIAYMETPTPFGESLPGIHSAEEATSRLKGLAAKRPQGEPLLAWGWDTVALGKHLSKHDLDAVDTTRPVLVWDASLHFGYCNSFTLQQLKLTAAKHGKITGVGVGADGQLTGSFLGVQALYCLMPMFSTTMKPARALDSLHYITELGREHGVTTMCELMHGGVSLPLESALYRHFYNNESTPMRCVVVCDAAKVKASCLGITPWATSWLKRLQRQSTEKLIFNNGVKFFTDDAFLGLTMQLGYPGYADGRKGIWNCGEPGAKYAGQMLPWWKAGCRIHVHSNGDAAQDATAEALASLQTAHPRFDHRFCLEHYGISSVHLHRRLRNLGASVAVNAYYVYHRGELNIPSLGKDRAFAAARLRSIVDCGLPLALHTDTPVAPPRPLEELWIAANRLSDDGAPMCEAERVTTYQALRMKTIDAAYVHGIDALLGSIEAGKLADFTVLDRNPLAVPTAELRSLRVLGTVVGGVKYPAVARASEVPRPPNSASCGIIGQLLWLFGATARSEGMRAVWWRLAALAGCRASPTPARLGVS